MDKSRKGSYNNINIRIYIYILEMKTITNNFMLTNQLEMDQSLDT